MEENVEQVTLMTLHAAKGLEFKCVFIPGCEDGIIPYTLFDKDSSDIEEERRLLYVGMTRAQRILYLTNAKRRNLFGMNLSQPRSAFVSQIQEDLIRIEKSKTKKPKAKDRQLDLF